MVESSRQRSTGLTLGAVLLWIVAAVALWFLLLRVGEDQVSILLGTGEVTSVFVLGVAAVVILAGSLGCLACAERLSTGPSPAALAGAGGALLLLVVVAVAVLLAQASMAMAVADEALVEGATAAGQVVAAVVGMVLAVAAATGIVLGLRRVRGARRL